MFWGCKPVATQNVQNLDRLRKIVGADYFGLIVEEMPGVTLHIPTDAEYYNKENRNRLIRQDFFSNVPEHQLQSKYGLSRSQLMNIINSRPETE